MKRTILFCSILLLLFTGCGGGTKIVEPKTTIESLTGTWAGGMNFTSINDPSDVVTYNMEAIIVQTGSTVTGTYELFPLKDEYVVIHTGVFLNTFRTEDTLTGLLVNLTREEGAPFFNSPLQFTATIAQISISGGGLVSMDRDGWNVTFTLTLVSAGFNTAQIEQE